MTEEKKSTQNTRTSSKGASKKKAPSRAVKREDNKPANGRKRNTKAASSPKNKRRAVAKTSAKAPAKSQTKTSAKPAVRPAAKSSTKRSLQSAAKKTRTSTRLDNSQRDRATKPTLRVIPLGGLDGIGKNMTVFEYNNSMIVVDAGLMFPDDDTPGVDLILPDFSYVVENSHKLLGVVVTHGHEDHTGALPYLLKDVGVNTQIISAKLTLGLIRGKLSEHGIKKPKLREIVAGESIKLGPFEIEFIAINHSIPDALAVFIKSPVGNVLHTGDFKFDQTPIDGKVADFAALARLKSEGVMLLLSDSTNAESPGITKSEASVGAALKPLFAQAKGKIIVASFSSHIHRLQQVCDQAVAVGRKVVVTGRSMIQNTKIARELGYLNIDDDDIIDAFDLKSYRPQDIVVLCTGSQGEPLSALSRMAAGEHRSFTIEHDDTVIISATPVPGNEKAVANVVNKLTKSGTQIFDKRNAEVHVSGHAAAEELKLMINMLQPEYFIPVHGEARQLAAHKDLAMQVGIPEDYIFLLDNGDVMEFDEDGAKRGQSVPNGIVYVDGLNVGDIDTVVLRDRQHLSQDGIVTLVLTINKRQARVIEDVQVIAKGLTTPDDKNFHKELGERVAKTLERSTREKNNISASRRSVRDSASQFIYERTRQRPMVIPVILEV